MSQSKIRVTLQIERSLHAALRLKARTTGQSLSAIVQEAISTSLEEDELDLAAIESRRHEIPLSLEEFLSMLKTDGTI